MHAAGSTQTVISSGGKAVGCEINATEAGTTSRVSRCFIKLRAAPRPARTPIMNAVSSRAIRFKNARATL